MKKIINYKDHFYCIETDLEHYIIYIANNLKGHLRINSECFQDYKNKSYYSPKRKHSKDALLPFYSLKHFKEKFNSNNTFSHLELKQLKDYT